MLMMLINGICLAIGFWFVTVVMAALSGAAKKLRKIINDCSNVGMNETVFTLWKLNN